ncbi:hypothetical protein U8607_24275 [Methylobacterium durans]|uniref:methyltransferase domain-containing protein n=1 Tax=Methylobacterium durans TaxID=2202825 RepID=UPI002AFF2959|nr:methyltransferase domain-containing protein [Methylobacterium durans]MEA1835207.1 hypothetical protein [Methylobacterium durans]
MKLYKKVSRLFGLNRPKSQNPDSPLPSNAVAPLVSIAIPTFNSSRWIRFILEYYRSEYVEPVFFVDARTTDDTVEQLRALSARVVTIQAKAPIVEAMIGQMREHVVTPWILRVDDDEVPSRELLRHLKLTDNLSQSSVISVVRRWLRYDQAGQLVYSGSEHWNWSGSQNGEDRQFRLYQKDNVSYRADIHTPGFFVDESTQLPDSMPIYHFDWILRSEQERREKMRRYDQLVPGSGEAHWRFYLPEEVEHWEYESAIDDEAVLGLALHLGEVRNATEKAETGENAHAHTVEGEARQDIDALDSSKIYSENFFAGQEAGSLRSAQIILRELWPLVKPSSVVDVGCGVCPWLKTAGDLGATVLVGIDGDYVNRNRLMVEKGCFYPCDIESKDLRSVLKGTRRFDLAMCLEVAEHLSQDRAASFIAELTSLSDVVLFSAAVVDQGGTNHINEQWPLYWYRLFSQMDFDCFDILRPKIWEEEEIEWWYIQNVLVYVKRGSPTQRTLLQKFEPKAPMALVHPRMYSRLLTQLRGG